MIPKVIAKILAHFRFLSIVNNSKQGERMFPSTSHFFCYRCYNPEKKCFSRLTGDAPLANMLKKEKGIPLNPEGKELFLKSSERLAAQIRFVLEADKLKKILRRSYITDGSRREDDAEHSWHLALMVLILGEYSENPNLNLLRVLGMVIVHDLVEIDAGDTFVYDTAAIDAKIEKEKQAADRIFAILPEDQAQEFRGLWEEFEAGITAESRFARALDRVQPILLNWSADGRTWREHGIGFEKVMDLNRPVVAAGAPGLEQFIIDLLNDAKKRRFFDDTEGEQEHDGES